MSRSRVPLPMLKVGSTPQPDAHALYDGSQVALLNPDSSVISQATLRVLRMAYDGSAGILRVLYSDGSQKVLLGFITDFDLNVVIRPKVGEVGASGPPGINGKNGRDSSAGPPGCVGIRGDPGPKGSTGRAGRRGIVGDTGPKGEIGDASNKGWRGLTGPVGNEGPAGYEGRVGKAGLRGSKGITGDDGIAGPVGDRGCIGDIGPDGYRGDAGYVGRYGPRGDIGITPPNLVQGRKGKTGKSGAVTSIIGGDNVTVTWVADECSGLYHNVRIDAVCESCVTCYTTTTADPNRMPPMSSTTTTPDPCTNLASCEVTIADKNANKVIDDNYDVFVNGVYAFAMPGNANPETVYKKVMPSGRVTLTFKRTASNGHGTEKQLEATNGKGVKTTLQFKDSLQDGTPVTPIGSFATQTFSFTNDCPPEGC